MPIDNPIDVAKVGTIAEQYDLTPGDADFLARVSENVDHARVLAAQFSQFAVLNAGRRETLPFDAEEEE